MDTATSDAAAEEERAMSRRLRRAREDRKAHAQHLLQHKVKMLEQALAEAYHTIHVLRQQVPNTRSESGFSQVLSQVKCPEPRRLELVDVSGPDEAQLFAS